MSSCHTGKSVSCFALSLTHVVLSGGTLREYMEYVVSEGEVSRPYTSRKYSQTLISQYKSHDKKSMKQGCSSTDPLETEGLRIFSFVPGFYSLVSVESHTQNTHTNTHTQTHTLVGNYFSFYRCFSFFRLSEVLQGHERVLPNHFNYCLTDWLVRKS